MKRLNRDAITALLLLILCGVFFWKTFEIREVPFSEMGSEIWPRFVLIALAILSLVYLFRSVTLARPETEPFSWSRWIRTYQNAIICFVMFLIFVLALPHLGMLVAGILFVFLTQSIIGGFTPRLLLMHAAVAVLAVGGMWSIFTFALRVVLPAGELFS
jgi:hypothetical protein